MDEIPCTIKPIKLVRLHGNKESGCGVIVVSFPTAAGVKIKEICFQNNYTATLTLKGKRPVNIGNGKFKTIVKDFILMTSPHFANESQNQFKIDFDKIGFGDVPFVCLHFILRQPSPVWQKFGLEEIKFFKTAKKLEAKEEKEESPFGEDKSSGNEKLEGQLKAIKDMTRIVQNVQMEEEPIHFDVNGSYDINLLSYN